MVKRGCPLRTGCPTKLTNTSSIQPFTLVWMWAMRVSSGATLPAARISTCAGTSCAAANFTPICCCRSGGIWIVGGSPPGAVGGAAAEGGPAEAAIPGIFAIPDIPAVARADELGAGEAGIPGMSAIPELPLAETGGADGAIEDGDPAVRGTSFIEQMGQFPGLSE